MQVALAASHEKVGDMHLQLADAQSALSSYQSGFAILEVILAADPNNSKVRSHLSTSYSKLGDAYLQLGDDEAALKSYKSGMAICEAVAAADENNKTLQRNLMVSHERLGDVLLKLGETHSALKEIQKGLEINSALALADKRNAEAQRGLAISYEKLGDVHLKLREVQESIQAYQRSRSVFETLSAADPENAQARKSLFIAHYKVAMAHQGSGAYIPAAQAFERAAGVLTEMIRRGQLVDFAKRANADMTARARRARRVPIAIGDWDNLLRQPAEELPSLLSIRGTLFAGRGEFSKATRAAEKLRTIKEAEASQLYDAACVFARAANSIQPSSKQAVIRNTSEQRQKWIKEAIETLKQSAEAGWTDFGHMRNDPDLAVLRDLADFKELGQTGDR